MPMPEQDVLARPAAPAPSNLESPSFGAESGAATPDLGFHALRGAAPGIGNAAQARTADVAGPPPRPRVLGAGLGNGALIRASRPAPRQPITQPRPVAERASEGAPSEQEVNAPAAAEVAKPAEKVPEPAEKLSTQEGEPGAAPAKPAETGEVPAEERPAPGQPAEITTAGKERGSPAEGAPSPARAGPPAAVPEAAQPAPEREVGAEPEAAAAPVAAITATDPGGILAQLATTPPSAAIAAIDQADQASAGALENQRHQAEQQLPEIAAPTGLPPRGEPTAPTEAAATGLTATTSVPEPKAAPEAAGQSQTVVAPPIPEVPPPVPTTLPGPEKTTDEDERARFEAKARQAMEWAGIDQKKAEEAIPTTFGPRPSIAMTGDADPQKHFDEDRGPADAATAKAKAEAAEGINADHGLGRIYPAPSDARLSARRPLTGVGRPPAAPGSAGPAAPISSDVAGGLDRSLGPGLSERLGAKRDEYAAGQQQYEADSAQAHRDSRAEIAQLTANAARTQRAEQRQAGADVADYQKQWRKELDDTEEDYHKKAGAAAKEQRAKIEEKRTDGERRAHAEIEKAERQAAEERKKKDQEAQEERAKKRKESGGFFGWVRSKAAALIDGLRKAINAIYDGLRKIVKGLFDLAKKAAMIIINAVRSVIVGLIKAFGTILKGLVSLALIAFPKIAKWINLQIDKAVDIAVEKVNAVADKLQSAVAAVLDFLANTIDKLLGLVQSLYNGLLTVIGMLIRGELKELIERLSNVVLAAKKSPQHFEAAAYSAVLGNVHDPLSPAELASAGEKSPSVRGKEGAQEAASPLSTAESVSATGPTKVAVDGVVRGVELSPELAAEVAAVTAGREEVMLVDSPSPDRTIAGMLAEISGGNQSSESVDQEEPKYPDDGLSPGRRAEIRWQLMKQGLASWWNENKVKIILGAVAATLAIAAAIFFSGGSILAAIGPIMSVLGPLFIGASIAAIGGHVQAFVTKSWQGDVEGGARSLSDALALGAVELITWLTFKAGGAVLRVGKAAAKAGSRFRSAVSAARSTVGKAIARGAGFVFERGTLVLKGIKGWVLKQFRRLRDLGAALLQRLRFRGFRLILRNKFVVLQGLINPWEDLAEWPLPEHLVDEAELASQHQIRIGKEPLAVSRSKGTPFERRAALYDEVRRYLNKPVLDPKTDVQIKNLIAARRAAKKGALPGATRHPQVSVQHPIPGRDPFRADFYVEGKEIISVKSYAGSEVSGQLAHVRNVDDVIEHLREFNLKYAKGREISPTTVERLGFVKNKLSGEYILEIPPQTYPIPERILEEAAARGITIRDILGKVYTAP
jgi:hypothetical protein